MGRTPADHVEQLLAADETIINLQWPEAMCWFGPDANDETPDVEEILSAMRDALVALKKGGKTLVWTMHNLIPHAGDHEDGRWARCYQIIADNVDATIHHSHCGKDRALATYHYGRNRHAVIGHGYDSAIPWSTSNQRKRARTLTSLKTAIFF